MIVEARNLHFRYGAAAALDGLSFRVERGALYGILGPNGSGKSTLFRLLATLLAPAPGALWVDGRDVAAHPREVRRKLGVVFQSSTLDARLTVAENLRLFGALAGIGGRESALRVERALEQAGLGRRRKDLAGALSGGAQKRLEIARALLLQPALLLLDEATAGLDPGARATFWEAIETARGAGVTVVFATHLLDESGRADRLLLMHRGRALAEDTPRDWLARIPGEVLEIEARDAGAAHAWLAARGARRIGAGATRTRFAVPHAARLLAEASEALPGAIGAASVRPVNFEDVFLQQTGATLDA